MTPPPTQPVVLSRQMCCPACGHEHMWLDCDWCDCQAHIQPGETLL